MNNNLFGMFNSFMKNPMQAMMQMKLGVPQSIAGDPSKIIQHLMNNGKISQDMYNYAKQQSEMLCQKR